MNIYYLGSSGLTHLVNKIKSTFTLSSITGTLAITKGGTGSTTASGARSNLGAIGFISSTTEPTDQNTGDIWFIEE